LEGARSFLDTSIHIGTLVLQTLAKFFRCQQASRNIAAGASVVLTVRNNAALRQSLFMVANPPLLNAASYICNQINRSSSQPGKNTVVNLAGDAKVNLRTLVDPIRYICGDGSLALV
jgi:hypothetical protein